MKQPLLLSVLLVACHSSSTANRPSSGGGQGHHTVVVDAGRPTGAANGSAPTAHLPLVLVSDVGLPGGSTRFDYQDVDRKLGHLVVSHMNDGTVLFIDLSDGTVLKEVKNIPVARGVAVADDVHLVFVTSSPTSLVLIDSEKMTEVGRVSTGKGPDGVAWDPADRVVGVSDQGDGALSLVPDAGHGARRQVKLGSETGNVVFDAARGVFWITVVTATPPDRLVAVDPKSAELKTSIGLAGCAGAHGLRLHPDGKTAFVACETNAVLARVDLDGQRVLGTGVTGATPDVMSIDPGLGWIYVAAESSDLTVFDVDRAGVALLGHDRPGDASHTVAVDPTTHRVFFPLVAGHNGTPVLRIMKPSGI